MLLVTIDSGAAEIEIDQFGERVDLGLKMREAIQSMTAQAESRHVTINHDVPLNLMARGIPTDVRGVFTRLLDNAIKFSHPTGGQIWVNTEIRDGQVFISVQDEGIGIAPEMQTAIFERFQQIDRQTMEQQGMGLGLTIAFGLVQLHGGNLQVESQPGEGTTMIISLPRRIDG